MFVLGIWLVGCASGEVERAPPIDDAQLPPLVPSPPTAPPPPIAAPPSAAASECPAEKTCIALAASDPEARVAEVFATVGRSLSHDEAISVIAEWITDLPGSCR